MSRRLAPSAGPSGWAFTVAGLLLVRVSNSAVGAATSHGAVLSPKGGVSRNQVEPDNQGAVPWGPLEHLFVEPAAVYDGRLNG